MTNERAIESVKPMKKNQVLGRFTVQVCDAETGKVKRTYESDNYVTDMHYTQAKHLQTQLAQGGWFPDDTGTLGMDQIIDGLHANDVSATPGVTPNFIICTDWDEAENTAVTWGKGNVTAFAPRVKVTALSTGRKGLLNETESSVATDSSTITWVWDWSTTQGNGTFQSIMFGNVGPYSDTNAGLYCGAGEHGRKIPYNDTAQGFVVVQQRPISDGTTVYLVGSSDDDSTPYYRWIDCTTEFNGGGAATADAASNWFQMTGAGGGAGSGFDWGTDWVKPTGTHWMTNNTSSGSATYFSSVSWDACHDGTNIYFFRASNSGSVFGVHAYNLGTGTELYSNTATGFTPSFADDFYNRHITGVTVVGTKLYVIYYGTNEPGVSTYPDRRRIARFNATTGAFEAFVDLDSVLAADEWLTGGIQSDGTDLIVETTQGIKKYTTSGSYVANSNIGMARLVYPPITGIPDGTATSNLGKWQEDGVAPDSTSVRWQLNRYRQATDGVHSSRAGSVIKHEMKYSTAGVFNRYLDDPYLSNLDSALLRVAAGSMTSTYGPKGLNLLWHDSKLWLSGNSVGGADVVGWDTGGLGHTVYSVDGFNIFSRARLDTPVTKSSSETMKITYQLVLPTGPLHLIPHVNPWA